MSASAFDRPPHAEPATGQQLSLFDAPLPSAGGVLPAAAPPFATRPPRPLPPLRPPLGAVPAATPAAGPAAAPAAGAPTAGPSAGPSAAPTAAQNAGARAAGPDASNEAAPAAGPRLQHPRAQRTVLLGEHRVGYEFRRARRRSIGFVVGADGLSVSAPRWVSVGEVEQALQAKAGWILRKLHEQHDRARRMAANRIEWREGAGLPFLGETVVLVLDPRVTGAQLRPHFDSLPGVPRHALHIGLPQAAGPEQVREVVQSWLQRQARRVFEERCAHFAPRLGVHMKRLSLSSAATRWGSASADGSVRLNWRLIHFAQPVIDYVVAHELAHLREMNHSAAFWEVVRSVVPDYEHRRGALRSDHLPSFD